MVRLICCVVTLLVLLAPSAPAEAAGWQVLLGGDDANTPRMPSGVAVDSQGSIYVADTGGSRIAKLAPSGRVLATIGKLGPDAAGLRRPRGIAVDVQDNLYIADTANHRIQRFSSEGVPLGPWGTIGSAPGEFILPSSLAFDSVGQLYVADTGNHRIQKLAPDGAFVSEWAGVHFPHGLAIDAEDAVYVSDEAGVRKFTANGELLAEWVSPGRFGDPYGLAIDAAGSIWVADTDYGRILALAPTGEVLLALGSEGKEVGRFKYPEAVAVDAHGRVYVADRGNDRVQLWQP